MASASVTPGATFLSVYSQFLDDLKGTFPEYASVLTLAGYMTTIQSRFIEVWRVHTNNVAIQNSAIFNDTGLEMAPGFLMTKALWSELSDSTRAAIWKYLSTLLLLSASDSESGLWGLSGFQHDMEAMMGMLKGEGGDHFKDMFEKLGKMAETFGIKDLSGAAGKFKIPERLFKGHIAKIAEELVKEFKPEDFGISPEMLESDDPARVFNYLQEIFTKKPETMMMAAQKIAKKIQAKFQRGELKREEIIREAEELMKEFSDNSAFSELFGSLGEMFKMGEKESGNEGSARRREVQERLRRKQAEKEARRSAGGAGTSNIIVSNADAVAAAAAMEALLIEEEAAAASATAKGTAKGGRGGKRK
jgi:hypothetical protein